MYATGNWVHAFNSQEMLDWIGLLVVPETLSSKMPWVQKSYSQYRVDWVLWKRSNGLVRAISE
jgi:hypothetical protein